MTASQLYDHALDLRELLEGKRHLIEQTVMGPESRAHLLFQITSLSDRVDQLMWESGALGGDRPVAGLELPGILPRVEPLPEVIP